MYRVLVAIAIEAEANRLLELPVWGERSGFLVVSCAHHGRQALELLRHEHYDMTIMEINLPLIDGLQLIRHIHAENLCPLVTVLSTSASFQYVRECILYGAFDYLPKMPDAALMSDMLSRAARRLDQNSRDHWEAGSAPSEEENAIYNSILRRSGDYASLFRETAGALYETRSEGSITADVRIRHLFYNLVSRLFAQYTWLNLYFDRASVNRVDALHVTTEVHTFDLYGRNLKHLVDEFWQMMPESADENVNQIVRYVLANPEEDLKLRSVAERTYINYSYLSTVFSARLGINYSEYVTGIRMKRAEYLLKYTPMMVGEIASRLRYRDAYYFSTLFKKWCGKTPTEYREAQRRHVDYSML